MRYSKPNKFDIFERKRRYQENAEYTGLCWAKFFPLKLEKNVITSEQSDVIHQRGEEKANEVRRTSVAKSVHKITRMRTTMQLNIININSHRS